MRRFVCLKASLFVFASLVPAIALATPPVVIPSVAAPGRAEQNLQIENARPDVGGQSVITMPDEAGHNKALKEGATFKLNSVSVENGTVFSNGELEDEYKEFIGQNIGLATLNTIASRITAHYRNAGYILSRAIVPPQRINNGAVKIQVVEGFISQVVFKGAPVTSKLLNDYADKIRAQKPLNASTLEHYLLLIEDLPGMKALAVLLPSESTPGASDVVITLTEKTVDGSVAVDNRGSRYIGPYQGSVTVNANNILGYYERTQFHGVATANPGEETFGQIVHEEQLDSDGTKLALSAGHTHTNPGYKLKAFDIKGVDTSYSAEVSHPFIRSRQTNLYGNAQFDIRNTDTESLGIALNGDRLRVARVGASYDFVDSTLAINKAEAQISKGFGWLDDTSPFLRSVTNGHTSFYKATGQASRLQPISGPFGLLVSTTGQLSSDTLLSAEQFGIGGANFGSAYDPSEITGDSGMAGRAELQFSTPSELELIPSYQFYYFYDLGKVWTRNPAAGSKPAQSLADTGFGTRFNIMEPISGNIELAIPMTRAVAANDANGNGNGARVFFSLAYRY